MTFQIDSYGAAVPEERVLSFSGDLQQVTTGSVVNTIATVLDARGLALSGADVDYAAVTGPEDRGTLVFQNGNSRQTNSDGTVTQSVQLTGAGKVRFNVTLHEEQLRTAMSEGPFNSSPPPLAGEGGGTPAGAPAFTPVGHLATRPAIGADGSVWLSPANLERYRPETLAARQMVTDSESGSLAKRPLTRLSATIGVGRGREASPSLRTVRADFPHTALQLVVSHRD